MCRFVVQEDAAAVVRDMALEIVMYHMQAPEYTLVVTDQLFRRHEKTLIVALTNGLHSGSNLTKALGVRLTSHMGAPIDLRLRLSSQNELKLWELLASEDKPSRIKTLYCARLRTLASTKHPQLDTLVVTDPRDINAMIQCLSDAQSGLRELSIENMNDMVVLCRLLDTLTNGALASLRRLSLRGRVFSDDEGMQAFAEALLAGGTLRHLTHIHLDSNGMGDEKGIKPFSEALAKGALVDLKELNLSHNRIGDVGIKAFAEALLERTIQKVTVRTKLPPPAPLPRIGGSPLLPPSRL